MVNLDAKKTGHLLYFLIGIVSIIIVNQLSGFYYFRVDLTEEKRYTISDATVKMLEDLEDEVFVEVYLDGELPAGFRRLRKNIRETLEEFKIHADDKINYKFIDPSAAASEKARNEFYISLGKKGIQPTRLFDTENGKRVEKIILPGAVISYGSKETGVMLLKGNRSQGAQESLNQSIENVEYELANALRKLTQTEPRKIALLKGHRELDSLHVVGLKNVLSEYYTVVDVNLRNRRDLLGFDAIIMAQPKQAFSESDVYKIDQYLMRGGAAIFLIDVMASDMSDASGEGTISIPVELGLDNLFFRYGVRFNRDLILDLSACAYPVVVGNIGNQPQIQLMPWPFFPELNHYGGHVIVKSTDATFTKFVGTIDTVKAEGVTKTPLIFTSENTRVVKAPIKISLNDLKYELKPEMFNGGQKAIAWLLEGQFTSVFKNRILPEVVNKDSYIEQGTTKMVVVSDGDFVKNEVNPNTGQSLELGFDPFSQKTYANADFIVNALNYMLDEEGIITARKKEIKIRPLDKVKIDEDRTFWQVFNLGLPLILLVLFGLGKGYLRKKKYASF